MWMLIVGAGKKTHDYHCVLPTAYETQRELRHPKRGLITSEPHHAEGAT